MARRITAILVAILFSLVGAFILITWVGNAEERAVAGLDPVEVLVVTQTIVEGTAAETIGESVAVEKLPASAVGPRSIASLEEVAGMVTRTALEPGEQVMSHRFVSPSELQVPDEVPVPAGLHEISVLLEPRRVVGGRIQPGDTVAAFMSFGSPEPQTHLTLSKILVLRVDGGVDTTESPAVADAASTEDGAVPSAEESQPSAPASQVMVTLALSGADSEKSVYASEWGSLWLSKEAPDAGLDGTRIVTEGNIYP